ncbi:ABC transporter permease subunit [uncultured Salinisphaera sp.]|uniref:ABC transporter permease subunit n=1 Tax=uncultured Salinisphaera sp. TaxID=359372 RepID=UPI0032B149BE
MSQNNASTQKPTKDRLNPIVFYGSAITIIVFSLWTMIFTDQAQSVIALVQGWISNTFGWYYFLTVLIYLVFVLFVAVSRFGKIRLGPEQSRPEFNLFSWAAMLFSAGIGIGVIFFGIAEPIMQYNNAPDRPVDDVMAARHAMELTFLHWGISGWAIYSLVGMSLAFFSYRYDLPLTIRSALYPLFGQRIHGWIGHTVDIAAVVATVFGIAAALGIGIVQLNFGLEYMFGITASIWTQIFLVVAIVGIVASFPVGIVLALGRRSHLPAVRLISVIFIEFWRGVPLITVLFMASVMLPLFLPEGVVFDKLLRVLIGVTLFSAAYMAEVVRGGLQAIPKGQYEGAMALGLRFWQMMGLIILPQALKLVIPGIVNTFIGLFKDTTLVLIIGMFDLLGQIQSSFSDPTWSSPTQSHSGYLFAAMVFWCFCFGMSRYSIFMEKKLHTGHKR